MADILFAQIPNENIGIGTDLVQTSGRDTAGVAPGRYVSDSLATAALFAAHPRFVAQSANGRFFRALPDAGKISVEIGGAKGDNVSDDGGAIRASVAYASAIAARGIRFGSARYRMEGIPSSEGSFLYHVPSMVLSAASSDQEWENSSLSRPSGGIAIAWHPSYSGGIVELPLAADAVAGSRDVTLAPGGTAALALGDSVLWQLGELPYDPPETPNWDIARVVGLNGDVVTLDKPMPSGLVLATVTGANKRLRKMNILRDFSIRNLTLDAGSLHEGISLYGAQRIHLERIGGRNCGVGLVTGQYCDGVTLTDCWLDGALMTQPSYGSAFSFAESRNIVLNRPRAKSARSLVKAEAGAEVLIVGGHFENTMVDTAGNSLGSNIIVINASGRGSVTAQDTTITGFGGYRLAETSNSLPDYSGNVLFTGTTRMKHAISPYSLPLETISGLLDMEIAGVRQVYNFDKLRGWKRRFLLRDNEFLAVFGPIGILVRAQIYTSPGVTAGAGQQLTGFYVGRSGANGSNVAQGANGQLVPGQDVAIKCYGGTVGGIQWTQRSSPLQILVTTAPAAGLNAANEFVEFEGWFAELAYPAAVVSEATWRSADPSRDPFEALFTAYDLPPIAAGSEAAFDVTIPDMIDTDFIEAVRFTGGMGGLTLRSVTALAGKARLVIANPGTSTIDRTPADLAVQFSRTLIGK